MGFVLCLRIRHGEAFSKIWTLKVAFGFGDPIIGRHLDIRKNGH